MMDRLKHQLVAAISAQHNGRRLNIPVAGILLWNLYQQIAASRTYHSAGPNPISFTEIEAFARLHRWPLRPHHIGILRAMDNAVLEDAYRKQKERMKGKEAFASHRYAKAQPLTADAFDVVFS